MRTEFVYSLAALAAFPMIANANIGAKSWGSQLAKKDVQAEGNVDLVQGKYKFILKDVVVPNDNKLTVSIKKGGVEIKKLEVTASGSAEHAFQLDASANISFVASTGDKDITFKPEVELVFDFAGVYNKLSIEYNKLSTALNSYSYSGVQQDIADNIQYYDRVTAIGAANYAYYVSETEGLKGMYLDQSDVTGMDLYTKIKDAFTTTKAKEKTFQLGNLDGGDNGLTKLNERYAALKSMYVTTALTNAKKAANDSRNAYNADDTVEKLQAAQSALATYKSTLETQEGISADNEGANDALVAELAKVYGGGSDSYYNKSVDNINAAFTARNADLKTEVLAILSAYVSSSAYTDVQKAIKNAYDAKKSKAEKNNLINKIAEFKEGITRTVSDFNAYKATVDAAYVIYDAQKEAADKLSGDDFLSDYKTYVNDKVTALLIFIEANDKEATVENLTEKALNGKVADITAETEKYTAQKAIYDDWKALQNAVNGKTTDLNNAKGAIDGYAKDTKKLDQGSYKPTTIWGTTVSDIEGQISSLLSAVNSNKTDASNFKNNEDNYKKPLAAIATAINDLKSNANAATDIYANVDAQVKKAKGLKDTFNQSDLQNKLKALDIWNNQVTTDETIKARTPYKTVSENDITTIDGWDAELTNIKSKTAKYNKKKPATDNANQGNILGYLTKKYGDGTAVLANEISHLTAMTTEATYKADQAAFEAEMEAAAVVGLKNMINAKATALEARVATLQQNINDKLYGNVSGALLQTEINAITEKINAAKQAAAAPDAKSSELSTVYSNITALATDMGNAETHASTYKSTFDTFVANYNTLNGTEGDASTVQTVFGLKKKVSEQQAVVDALNKLTDSQKTTFKNNVAGVSVKKTEKVGEQNVEVTYALSNIEQFINDAKNNEKLTNDEITKYQGIIDNLKDATAAPVTQAQRMNTLETLLAEINFTQAANDVKAKDANTNGFYYKQVTETYTNDFNTLKGNIESDTDLGDSEYKSNISDLKTKVDGAAAKAETNLNKFNAAKDYYDKAPNGAVQKYDEYVATLKAERQTSELERQLTILATLKEAMDEKYTAAVTSYNNGTASDADKNNITDKFNDIKDKYDEFYDEVNYNAQVAADNKAIYDAITAAHTAADDAYATSAGIINPYKNFKSTELKAAAAKAQNELTELLNYLAEYDAKVAAIQKNADDTYAGIVSPAAFDKDQSFKAQFDAITTELNTKTEALSDKIKTYAKTNVDESVTRYTNAIAASRAKVAKFSSDDNDLPDATVNGLFSTIDDYLEAVNNVKNDPAKIKALDDALVTAKNKINSEITEVEQNRAYTALDAIGSSIDTKYMSQWSSADRKNYNNILYNYSNQLRVDNFASYKQTLKNLKAMADQLATDNAAKNAATTAINNANKDLKKIQDCYQQFAAGYTVKATIEEIAANLANYPESGVTVEKSGEWKAAAEGISGDVTSAWNSLFDAEVEAIKGLIAKAKEENLTYGAADKATILADIETEAKKLEDAKEAVAKPTDDTDYKTKKDALLNDLKYIEKTLSSYIKTMTDVNETNINVEIANNLSDQVTAQETMLNNALTNVFSGYYTNIYNSKKRYDDYITSALYSEQNDIQVDIDAVKDYITFHTDEIVAYKANVEAMIADIVPAITELEGKAQTAKDDLYNYWVSVDNDDLQYEWSQTEKIVSTAKANIDYLEGQLKKYGSADNYKNKISKLNEQRSTAEGHLADAKARAENKSTLREKYLEASGVRKQLNTDVTGIADNCSDIEKLAKQAYIDDFIAALNAQVIADTWSASANYTATDKNTLTKMLNDLKKYVTDLKSDAEGRTHAEDIRYYSWTDYGVITTLNDGEAKFNDDLAALKQALKDMSLVEDVKGHINGNDEIKTDDLESLADIILNNEEETADADRCDINGDGDIDVTDLVWLRYYLVHEDWPNAGAGVRAEFQEASSGADAISMKVVSTNGNITRVAVNLDNETTFNAFQMQMMLPAGAKVVGKSLGERVEGANLLSSQSSEGVVSFVALSTGKNVIAGNEGAVLYLDIEDLNGTVSIGKAIFVDTALNGYNLAGTEATGIRETIANAMSSATQKFYDMSGRMMESLKNGINIIRNADGTSKKVLK